MSGGLGLGTGVLIGGAQGAERIGEQAEAIPERLPTVQHLGDPRPSNRAEPRTGRVS